MTPGAVEIEVCGKKTRFTVAKDAHAKIVTKTGKELGVQGKGVGAHVSLYASPENDTGISFGMNLLPNQSNFVIVDNVTVVPQEDKNKA